MDATHRHVHRALLLIILKLAGCDGPSPKQEAVVTPVQHHVGADSVVEHPGCYFEMPCYRLALADGEVKGPVAVIESSRYRGLIWMRVQADTLRRQLKNVELSFVRLADKQTGEELKWHRDGTEPMPAELLRMLPELRRRILAARLQVVTSTDVNCVMPSNWTLSVRVR